MSDFNVTNELLRLGYSQENILPNLTPVFSEDGKRIYVVNNIFGVMLHRRGDNENDKHVVITLLIEDDGLWHEGVGDFSGYWVKDLQRLLKWVNKYLETEKDLFKEIGYGYEFLN